MFENLSEQAKTYVAYAGIAITSAAVGALILLTGQGINNRRHPQVVASAITGDMLRATHGKVQELQEELERLNGQTQTLTDAQTAAEGRVRTAQEAVNDAGEGGPTPAQRGELEAAQQALEAAQAALRDHNAQLRAQVEALNAQIANEQAVADLIGNDDQRAILVRRLNQIPVPQAQAQESAPVNTEGQQRQ